MKYSTRICFSVLVLLFAVGISCIYSRTANDAAVEKLRQNLVSENFDEIYRQVSKVTRSQLSQDEFVSKLRDATNKMKAIDPEIKWVRNESILYDKDVFRDDNFSSLDLKQNGRKLNIVLDWAPEYTLCGMSMIVDVSEHGDGVGVRVFRNCD